MSCTIQQPLTTAQRRQFIQEAINYHTRLSAMDNPNEFEQNVQTLFNEIFKKKLLKEKHTSSLSEVELNSEEANMLIATMQLKKRVVESKGNMSLITEAIDDYKKTTEETATTIACKWTAVILGALATAILGAAIGGIAFMVSTLFSGPSIDNSSSAILLASGAVGGLFGLIGGAYMGGVETYNYFYANRNRMFSIAEKAGTLPVMDEEEQQQQVLTCN